MCSIDKARFVFGRAALAAPHTTNSNDKMIGRIVMRVMVASSDAA
jgi:hypothetical protein